MKEKKLESLIDVAIDREMEAYNFYRDLADKVEDPNIKDTLEYLAGEEQKHREFLMGYRDGRYESDSLRLVDVVDYKIAEYLEEPSNFRLGNCILNWQIMFKNERLFHRFP